MYSASLQGCEALKMNSKKIFYNSLGSLVSASQPQIEVKILIYRKRLFLIFQFTHTCTFTYTVFLMINNIPSDSDGYII
jgi:hypothetical protein